MDKGMFSRSFRRLKSRQQMHEARLRGLVSASEIWLKYLANAILSADD
jgi:hypothetical protein